MTLLITARNSTLETFSSFLSFSQTKKNPLATRWETSQELKANFAKLVIFNQGKAKFNYSIDDYNLFFYCLDLAQSRNDLKAKNHVAAYLEEPCYWAAKRISKKIRIPRLSASEVFFEALSIGRGHTNNPQAIAKKYESYDETRSSLKNYSEMWLNGIISDEIYKKYNIGKYSDWGLLKIASKTALLEALLSAGLNETKIAIHLLAWQCYKDVCFSQKPEVVLTRKKISKPTLLQLQKSADLYNVRRLEFCFASQNLSARHFELLMNNCIKALRQQEKSQSILDCAESLSDYDYDDPLNEKFKPISKAPIFEQQTLIEAPDDLEYTEEQLHTFLSEELNLLPEFDKKILTLAYGLALQQSEIGKNFGKRQDKISRQLSTIAKAITKGILKRVNSTDTPALEDHVEECLKDFCKMPLNSLVAKAFKKLDKAEQKLLRLYYGGDYQYSPEKLKNIDIAVKLKIELELEKLPTDPTAEVKKLKQHFCLKVKNYAQKYLGINLDLNNPKIDNLVEQWLTKKALYDLLLKA